MARPRVSVFIATSLDGFIAREDGSIDFLDCVNTPGEDYGFAEFFAQVDTVVLGRATWDSVRCFAEWPFTGKHVVVLSRSAITPTHGEQLHAGALAPLLQSLHEDGCRHVYLDGGKVIRQGLVENLVDEMTISLIPVLVGRGRPLFGDTVPASTWSLVDTRGYASGLVQCRWRPRDLPPA